ncbi:hypothetical protein GCM10018787_07050 [Streptomyces thermodiastaticus]|nr:hypothetical protein GCM10018787_07050 [Streptomyces thermodiastaticus]
MRTETASTASQGRTRRRELLRADVLQQGSPPWSRPRAAQAPTRVGAEPPQRIVADQAVYEPYASLRHPAYCGAGHV